MSAWYSEEFCSEELAACHQTPTLIGCIFLRNRNQNWPNHSWISLLAVISEALDFSTVFTALLKRFCVFFSPLFRRERRKRLAWARRFGVRAWRWPTFTREPALSSALSRFTVLFEMGRSGTNLLWSSGKTLYCVDVFYQHNEFIEFGISFSRIYIFDCVCLGITISEAY